MNLTTFGIDMAKNAFSLHGVDGHGKTVLKKAVSRDKLLETLANQPRCIVAMEACTGAHHWAGQRGAMGFEVCIIAPRFVPVRPGERQAILCLHRIRLGVATERTVQINQLRGLARRLLHDVWQRFLQLNTQVLAYDREIESWASSRSTG
jgi:transposase